MDLNDLGIPFSKNVTIVNSEMPMVLRGFYNKSVTPYLIRKCFYEWCDHI